MATDSPYKTFSNLYTAVLEDFKETTSSTMVSLVKRWINEGQEQVILRKKRDFLNKTFNYTLEAPTTSTFSITNGSTSVTLTGTASLPTTSAQEHKFVVQGFDEVYDISSISTGAITLSSAYTGTTSTAVTGTIFQSSVLMDDTIRSVHKVYHDRDGHVILFDKGPEDFRDVVQGDPDLRDFASFWTIFGFDSVAVSSDVADQKRLQVYPYPHKSYTLHVDANVDIPSLVNDSDESLLPIQNRQILYWYAMHKLALYHQDVDMARASLENFNTFLRKMDGKLMPGRDLPQIQRDNLRWRGRGRNKFRTFTFKRGSE